MRAAVVYQHGDLDQIVFESDYPEPAIPEGWVKIRVRASSINYHDVFSQYHHLCE